MSPFEEALNMAAADACAHLGEDIYINGIPVRAIFIDEEEADEQGRYRSTRITIKKEDARFFKEDDLIVARDRDFRITHIPDTHEPLIDIELKNA